MKLFKRKTTEYLNDLEWIEDTSKKIARILNDERDANTIISRLANEIADSGEVITSRNRIRWSLAGSKGTKIQLSALRGIDLDDPSKMRWHPIIQMRGRYAGLKLTIAHNGDIEVSAEPVPGGRLGQYALKARDDLTQRFGIPNALN